MKSQILFLGLAALALGASARTVAPAEARKAASVWARTGLVSGSGARAVSALATDGGAKVYSAALSGGTVFLTGDTEFSPVILFVSGTNDFSTVDAIDRNSPLWAILNCHQAKVASARASAGTGSAQAEVAAAEGEWAALLSGEEASEPSLGVADPVQISTLSDVRAGPLVQTKWSQSVASGKRCYNYYTPKLNNGEYAVCGCVATAMSQIMRYHKYPAESVSPVTRECYVQASTLSQSAATKKLTSQGGVYEWSKMPLTPATGVTEAQCQAIGKLTSDAGIAVCMSYDTDGSGAFVFNVAPALMNVFGYASAHFYSASGNVSDSPTIMRKAMLSNLDAGYPVLMSISGTLGGHAVVGDGYGYKDGKLYLHVNMGWAGSSDAWYAPPNIGSFTVFDDLVYDIFPKAEGGKTATLSGRVVDDEGEAVSGVKVELKAGADVVAEAETSSKGVYGVRVAPGSYDVEVTSADGTLKETQNGLVVAATATKTGTWRGYITDTWIKAYYNIPSVTTVGNLQSTEEIVFYKPTVRIGADHQYASLEKALADAKSRWSGEADDPVRVEIFDDTELAATRTVDFPCVIYSTDPTAFSVTRAGAAALNVAAEGVLTISNVTFAANGSTLVEVAKEGLLTVSEGVTLGVPIEAVAVRTQRADGFLLAARPVEWFSIECASAKNVNDVFGYAAGALSDVTVWAGKFANLDDPNGELAGAPVDGGSSPYALQWALLPVPLEDATAYYVLGSAPASTNCFRRLDRLFELFENESVPAEIALIRNGTLSRKVTPKAALTFRSPNGSVVSNLASTAGFAVTNGIALTIDGVSFDGYEGSGLFEVDGGELTLKGDTVVRNVTGTDYTRSGAVTVMNGGKVTVGSEEGKVVFDGCANAANSSKGGAFYMEKGSLDLKGDVTVTNCSARQAGGAIYYKKAASVSLSGRMRIFGNKVGENEDDLYYDPQTQDMGTRALLLTGSLEAGSCVGIRTYSCPATGVVFAVVSSAFTDKSAIEKTAKALICENDDSFEAATTADSTAFCWALASSEVKTVDPAEAEACVVEGGTRRYYGSVQDALLAIGAGETVEILRDVELAKDLAVTGLTQKVTLKSGAGGSFSVTRVAPCEIRIGGGVSLTLEDLVFSGALDADHGGNGRLIAVEGGDLTLGSGVVVENVTGTETRVGAIGVDQKGILTMLSGSEIRNCVNGYAETSPIGVSCGGAITADNLSTVRLLGGVINGCQARNGGAVFVANESTVEFGGDFTATANTTLDSESDNVSVAYVCPLRLVSPLTGRVGYTPGVEVDANVFGSVSADFDGTDAEMAESAHRFSHDKTGDIGFAVRSEDETLLVWSDALAADGSYTDATGRVYTVVSGGTPIPVDLPVAEEGLVYNAEEQVGVAAGRGFVVSKGAETAAGSHQATVTLKVGFVWSDSDPATVRTVEWTIAPAALSVSARAASKQQGEADPAFAYDVEGLQGQDTAATVLTGELSREAGEAPGTYAITQGTLKVVGSNYTLAFSGATFTITGTGPTPPAPEPVPCQPFAFTAISRQADGSWLLTINPAVRYCSYTLQTSDDLATWTPVGDSVEATADGDLSFAPTSAEAKRFWKVIGKDGVTPAGE